MNEREGQKGPVRLVEFIVPEGVLLRPGEVVSGLKILEWRGTLVEGERCGDEVVDRVIMRVELLRDDWSGSLDIVKAELRGVPA